MVLRDVQELPRVLLSADGRLQRRAGRVSPVKAARLFLPQPGTFDPLACISFMPSDILCCCARVSQHGYLQHTRTITLTLTFMNKSYFNIANFH